MGGCGLPCAPRCWCYGDCANGAFARGCVGHRSAAVIRTIGATALAFVPAVILVMTIYRSHESFPVMLRKDYLTLLNCVLLSMAAAFLPLAVLSRLFYSANLIWLWPFSSASEIYFLVLVTFLRANAVGQPACWRGQVAASGWHWRRIGGMVAFLLLGSFMYFLASPFLLYYAYVLLGSDLRSSGRGLARAPASAATVGHRDHQSPGRRRAVSARIDLPAAPSIRRSQATIRARR